MPTIPAGPGETWDEVTGAHALPVDAETRARKRIKEITKGVVETSQVVAETSQVVADTSARVDEANSGISTLRMETRAHVTRLGNHLAAQDVKIGEIQNDVAGVKGDVKGLTAHVDHIRKTTDSILPTLLEQLTKDRDAARAGEIIVRTASVEVHKHAQIAAVEIEKHQDLAAAEVEKSREIAAVADAADRAAFERKRNLKVITIAGSVVAGAVALIELLLHG